MVKKSNWKLVLRFSLYKYSQILQLSEYRMVTNNAQSGSKLGFILINFKLKLYESKDGFRINLFFAGIYWASKGFTTNINLYLDLSYSKSPDMPMLIDSYHVLQCLVLKLIPLA